MTDSARKLNPNRDSLFNNETMLQFLQRKKQVNLENTLQHSQRHSTKKKYDVDLEEDLPQTRDLTKYRTTEQHHSYISRPTVTPRKILFDEPQQTVSASKPSQP